MKILYILVSQTSDFYYEQALVSVMSAKYRMSNIPITLLTDEKTKLGLVGDRALILRYVDEVVSVDLEEKSPLIRSRILKTKMRNLVKGDFLYVDVDTIWAKPLDTRDFVNDVMGVFDGNSPLEEHERKDYIYQQFVKIGYSPIYKNHINGGVLFMKDSPAAKNFSELWNAFWGEGCDKGVFFDQPSLHKTIDICEKNFSVLDGSYNAQIAVNLNYLSDAKIIHYHPYGEYSDKSGYPYKLQQKKYWMMIKKFGCNQEVDKVIENPKACFDSFFHFKNGDDILLEKKKFYGLTKAMLLSNKRIAKFLSAVGEKIANAILKIYGN